MSRPMKSYDRVCVFCSIGEDLAPMLKELRWLQPDAHITAVHPPGVTWTDEAPCPADILLPAEFGVGSLLRPVKLLRFIGGLRKERFGLVITQFESLRLRCFVVLLRPEACEAWLPSTGVREMSPSLAATLWDLTRLRVRGYTLVLWALLHATVFPNRVKVRAPRDP